MIKVILTIAAIIVAIIAGEWNANAFYSLIRRFTEVDMSLANRSTLYIYTLTYTAFLGAGLMFIWRKR